MGRSPLRLPFGRGNSSRGSGGEALQHPLLLLADQREDLVIDGDEGLAFHLGVVVAAGRGRRRRR